MTKAKLIVILVAALEEAAYRMEKSPDFNAWDLGPMPSLVKVREAIDIARKEAKRK